MQHERPQLDGIASTPAGPAEHRDAAAIPGELRTRDPAVLRTAVAETTTAHEIRLRGTGVDGLTGAATLDGTNIVFVRYGGEVVVEAPPTHERFTLTLPLGPMTVGHRRLAGSDIRTSAFVLATSTRTLMGPDPWSGALVLATNLHRLREHLAAVVGHPVTGPLEFSTSREDHGPLPREHLDAATKLAWHAAGTAPPSPGSARLLEQNLLSTILLSLPHSRLDVLHTAPSGASPTHAEAARDWMEEHFPESVSVVDIARAVRLSVRQLQTAVSRRYESTPTRLLRDIRLRRAREMLETGDITVSEAAHRCGISHLGRFSAQYRQRYGEPPSATPRRAHGVR